MSNAAMGAGAAFGIGDGASSESFSDLSEVLSISPPSQSTDIIDVTHLKSTNRLREFIAGFIDPGDVSLELNHVPGSAADTAIQALEGLSTTTNFRVTFPDGTSGSVTWIFAGFLSGYEPNISPDDKMTASITIKVTGATTVSTLG